MEKGQTIGGYRILDTLGEGGMGVVYRAEQLEPVRRFVALKVVRRGMDSAKVLARFDAERQALAVMDHPSIATVLDAGNTGEGLPYFVMELVDGVPITTYADQGRLDLRARVRLFTQVCRAVQHAHAKGVIHRDLKPSNILVSTTDGVARCRVIDFGIAKAVTPDAQEVAGLTLAEELLGTPAYMSPEQLGAGGDIDVRSDIYSLGVVLFELLCGALPLEPAAYKGWAAFAANLRNDIPGLAARFRSLADAREVVARHRSSDVRTLARDLSGDLTWIVDRATRPDREERYETANGLALELERYLSGHPVLAGPPGAGYRTRKFVARHPLGVAAGFVAVAAVAGVAVWQTIQAERIRQARDLADARRAQAEEVLDFMLTDLRAKLEPVGRLDIMDDVGRQALAYFAALPPEEYSEQELLSRSQALYQIGSVRLDQGDVPAADSTFQESLRLASALLERNPSNSEWLFGVGQAEFWAGEAARRQGDLAKAYTHFQSYLERSVELSARDTTNTAWLLEVGYGHTNVGAIHLFRGELEKAAEHMRRSLDVKEAVVAASPGDVRRRYDLARGYFNLARVQEDLGRLDAAVASLHEDIALKEGILSEQPDNATVLTTLADSENVLGRLHLARGRMAEAHHFLQRAYDRISALVERDPANARWRRSRGVAVGRLGELALRQGRMADAVRFHRQEVALLESAIASNPDQPGWRTDLAHARGALGEALARAGDVETGMELARASVGELAPSGPDGDERAAPAAAIARLRLGRLLVDAGRRDEGAVEIAAAVAALSATVAATTAPDHQVLAALCQGLAGAGRADEASPHLDALRAMGYAPHRLSELVGG